MSAPTEEIGSSWQARADELLKRGAYDRAARVLRRAMQEDPGQVQIVRALAAALVHDGREDSARAVFKQFVTDYPMRPQGWVLASQLEWLLRDRAAALRILGRALQILPNCSTLRRQMRLYGGNVKPNVIETPELGDELDRIVADTKMLGSIIDDPALEPEAMKGLQERLEALLAVQPNHADRHVLLARIKLKRNDEEGAIASLRKACGLNAKYPPAQRLLADVYAKQGHLDVAADVLRKLVAQGCDWPDLHVQLADIEKRAGHAEKSRDHLYSALRINPGYQAARQMLQAA